MATNLKPLFDAASTIDMAIREQQKLRKKLERADSALRAIKSWAMVGELQRSAVEALCKNTLEAIWAEE